jgi:hypothetical protein
MMKLRAKYIHDTLFNNQFRTINIVSAFHNAEDDPVQHSGDWPILTFKASIPYPRVYLRVSYDCQNKLTL